MNEPHKENDRRSIPASGAGGADPFVRQQQMWQSQPFLAQVLHAVPEIIIVLNASRQVVFANEAFLGRLKVHDAGDFGGRRWGDVLGCRHAVEEGGCGETRCCRTCGGLKAIEAALRGTRDIQDFQVLTRSGDTLELQVTAVPIEVGADRYVICTMADISAQRRRRVLERLFFHDVLNTAVGVRGLADLLKDAESERAVEIRGMLASAAATLIEQIQGQRLLTVAENGDLPVSFEPLDALEFLQGMLAAWQGPAKTRHLMLRLNDDSTPVRFLSDETILSHVLNSMLKNAFEASSRGTEIVLGCHEEDHAVVFLVRNRAVMPEDTQRHLFTRGFSTKESGRGLGTYSMKLLTEQFLGGKVGFTSAGNDGTTFTVRLPLTPPETPGHKPGGK